MSWVHDEHVYVVPLLGGMLGCSTWKCPYVIKSPTRPAPAQEHSPTSVEAARAIEGPQLQRDRVTVYNAIRSRGTEGATDEEIREMTGIKESTERPRRIDLVRENVVEDSGRTRTLRSGRQGSVWVARS